VAEFVCELGLNKLLSSFSETLSDIFCSHLLECPLFSFRLTSLFLIQARYWLKATSKEGDLFIMIL
jgi:hypothetical protein